MSGRQKQELPDHVREYLRALVATMDTPTGRAFVWAMLDRSGLYAPLMTANSQTFYNIGRRDFGVELLNDLTLHAFPQLRLMEDEARSRDARTAMNAELASTGEDE